MKGRYFLAVSALFGLAAPAAAGVLFISGPEGAEGQVPVPITTKPTSFVWDGKVETLSVLGRNTSGKLFTDFHIASEALQGKISIASLFFRSATCKQCFDLAAYAGGGSPGIKPGAPFVLEFTLFAKPVGVDSYKISVWGSTDPVPEPAAWLLLIAGFAATGAALRRSRPAVPAPA
jgi:hypothetical protein